MDFSQRLNDWLAFRGMKQVDLASRVGVSTSAVAQWCTGETKAPTQANQNKICKALGISMAEFWGPIPAIPPASPAKARAS